MLDKKRIEGELKSKYLGNTLRSNLNKFRPIPELELYIHNNLWEYLFGYVYVFQYYYNEFYE